MDLASDIQSYKTDAQGRHDTWLTAPVTSDITIVPGIGVAGKEALESAGITTTYQLIGKFLMLNRDNKKFLEFLSQFSAISKYRVTIVRAVAEKVAILFGDHWGKNWRARRGSGREKQSTIYD
jgi:hypothetical protein